MAEAAGPVAILANPASGRRRGAGRAAAVGRELARLGITATLERTASADDVEARARALAARAPGGILAVAGGDGTLRRSVQGLAGSDWALAPIPAGRGNDLAHVLGLPRDPARIAAAIAARRTRSIDLGRAGSHRFLTVATFGFDAEVSGIVHRREVPFTGTLAYLAAALKGLRSRRPIRARLSGDFGVHEGEVLLVATANTATYGGGFAIAPGALPDDGLLEVCVVEPVSTARLLWLLPRLLWGGHTGDPAVRLYATRSLAIETAGREPLFADGEPMGSTPARLEVVPGGLRVVVPGPARCGSSDGRGTDAPGD